MYAALGHRTSRIYLILDLKKQGNNLACFYCRNECLKYKVYTPVNKQKKVNDLPVRDDLFNCDRPIRPIFNNSTVTSSLMGGNALQILCKHPRAGTNNWFLLETGNAANKSCICCTTNFDIEKDLGMGYRTVR